MTAQIVKLAHNEQSPDQEKLSEDRARAWLYENGDGSPDRTFDVTMRHLSNIWGWSIYGVTKLLNSMEATGVIIRDVLPENGGTRITIAGQGDFKVVSMKDIETIQMTPSKILTTRLAQAYHGIIYDKPGFEHCDVEHLEMIEQALFSDICPSLQQAA